MTPSLLYLILTIVIASIGAVWFFLKSSSLKEPTKKSSDNDIKKNTSITEKTKENNKKTITNDITKQDTSTTSNKSSNHDIHDEKLHQKMSVVGNDTTDCVEHLTEQHPEQPLNTKQVSPQVSEHATTQQDLRQEESSNNINNSHTTTLKTVDFSHIDIALQNGMDAVDSNLSIQDIQKIRKEEEALEIIKNSSIEILQAFCNGVMERNTHRKAISILSALSQSKTVRNTVESSKRQFVIIQSWARRLKAKKSFEQVQNSVSTIQALWRSKFEITQKSIQEEKVIRIQNMVKTKQAKMELKNTLESIVKCQAQLRERLTRQQFSKELEFVEKIKALAKRRIEEKKIHQLIESSTSLQSIAKQVLQSKKKHQSLEAIQRLQSLSRTALVEKKYLQYLDSTLKIQALLLRQHQANHFSELRNSIILLQCACKAKLKRNTIEEQVKTVLTIDALYHAKREHEMFIAQREAISIFQQACRGFLQRKSIQVSKENIHTLQSLILGNMTRNLQQKQYEQIVRLTACVKSRLDRQVFDHTRMQVVCLQSLIRSNLAKQVTCKMQQEQTILASLVQALNKKRLEFSNFHSNKLNSSYIAACVQGKTQRTEFKHGIFNFIVPLQAHCRRYLEMKNRIKLGHMVDQVSRIQALIRSKKCHQEFENCIQKLKIIQALMIAKRERSLLNLKVTLATILSATSKAEWTRRQLHTHFTHVNHLNALTKRYIEVRKFHELMNSITLLQSRSRACLEQRNLDTQIMRVLHCQALCKGGLERKILQEERQLIKENQLKQVMESCTQLQAFIRAQHVKHQFRHEVLNVISLQSALHGAFIRKNLQRQHQLSTIVQSLHKSMQTRHSVTNALIFLRHLQCHTRRCVQKKHVDKSRESVITLQAKMRHYLCSKALNASKKAIEWIQAKSKSSLTYKQSQQSLQRILTLQALMRSFHEKHVQRQDLHRIFILNSLIRSNRSRQQVQVESKALVQIQALIRSRMLQQFLQSCLSSARMAQAMIRGRQDRHSKNGNQQSIVLLQALARRRLILTEWTHSKTQLSKLQSMFMSTHCIKHMTRDRNVITLIQSWIRSKKVRKEKHQLLEKSLQLKARFRQLTTSNQLLLSLGAIRTLQSAFRAKQQRDHYFKLKSLVQVVSMCFLSTQARQEVEHSLQQILQMQSLLRRHHCSQIQWRKILSQLVTLQAFVKASHARLTIEHSLNTLSQVQSVLKGRLSQLYLSRDLQRVLILQALIQSRACHIKWRALKGRARHFREKMNDISVMQGFIRGFLYRRDDLLYVSRHKNADTGSSVMVPSTSDILRQLYDEEDEYYQAAHSEEDETNDNNKDETIRESLQKLNLKECTQILGHDTSDAFNNMKSQELSKKESNVTTSNNQLFGEMNSQETQSSTAPPIFESVDSTLFLQKKETQDDHFNKPSTSSVQSLLMESSSQHFHKKSQSITSVLTNRDHNALNLTNNQAPHQRRDRRNSAFLNLSTKPIQKRSQVHKLIDECIRNKSSTLDLSGLDLDTIPYAAIECKHVTSLRLANNNLATLPSWFSETFKNVTDLDLHGNQLYELPFDLAQLPLRKINICENKFEFIPQQIVEMKSIEKMDLSGNVLLSLPTTIRHLEKIEELNISGNCLMTLPEDMKELKSLKFFKYDNNPYLQSEISRIAEIASAITGEKSKTIVQKLRNTDTLGYKEIVTKPKENVYLDPYGDLTDLSDATEMYNDEEQESDYTMTEEGNLSPRGNHQSSANLAPLDTPCTPPTRTHSDSKIDLLDSGIPSSQLTVPSAANETVQPISDTDSEDLSTTPPKYVPQIAIPKITLDAIQKQSLDSPGTNSAEISPQSLPSYEDSQKRVFGVLSKEGNEKTYSEVVSMDQPLFQQGHSNKKKNQQKKRSSVHNDEWEEWSDRDENTEEEEELCVHERELKEAKKIKERINMVLEILESERKYVKYLDVLWDLFYEPIVYNHFPHDKVKTPEESERLVPKSIAKSFFPHDLLTIKTFNKNFLSKLEERFKIYRDDPTKIYDMIIGDMFIKISPFFKIYTSYLSSYESCMTKIRDYRQHDTRFNKWLDKRKMHPKAAGLEIGSFMIMPVQRIPRYLLLLTNLFKNTPENHGDYSNLMSAIETVSESASTQNAKIKETNNRIKVYQLSKLMNLSDLVQPHRRLVREGEVIFGENSRVEWKMYLFNDLILFREKKRQKTKVSKTVKAYSLLDAYISGGGQNRLTMVLTNADTNQRTEKEIFFPSLEVKMEWVVEIEKALEEVNEKREFMSKGSKSVVRTSGRAGRILRALKSPKRDQSSPHSGRHHNHTNSMAELSRTNSTISTQSSLSSNLSSNTTTTGSASLISTPQTPSSSSLFSQSSNEKSKKKSILGKLFGGLKKKAKDGKEKDNTKE
nr:unnamed protein product [Naegleria fowleri]